MIESAYAQLIPKPSVPEFTVKYNNSVTNTTDPFTGINIIQIAIRNQPFEYSYNGTIYQLYYNFRTKPHLGEGNWTERYSIEQRQSAPYSFSKYLDPATPLQTSSDFTVITYALSEIAGFPSEGDMDIQVQAVVGHNSEVYVSDLRFAPGQYEPAIAFDMQGDWSSTQTPIIPRNPISTSTPTTSVPGITENPTATQSNSDVLPVSGYSLMLAISVTLAIIAVLLAIIALLLFYNRKTRKEQLPKANN